ncbi:MAG: lysozyme family protein [Sporolactobacillus sp.]
MKKIVTWILSMFVLIGCVYLILFIISSKFSPEADHVPFINDDRVISPKVEAYRPVFKKYAQIYGLADKTDLLMAMAMQESKGDAVDLMQASESQGLPRNTIKNQAESIKIGTQYFKKSLDRANGDIRLALQSYNFGIGFTNFVNSHGGNYSESLAEQFAKEKASELGWSSYGDPHYVSHVLRYYYNEKEKREYAKKNNS